MSSTQIHASLSLPRWKSARRKEPSTGPGKAKVHTPILDSGAICDQVKKAALATTTISDSYLPNPLLCFSQFSFWDEDTGRLQNISEENTTNLSRYMAATYGVSEMEISGPFLLLYCSTVPEPENRPFLVTGIVAVWLEEDGDEDLITERFPHDLGEGPEVTVSDTLAMDLKPAHLPKEKTLLALGLQFFPDASHISYLNGIIIVEYPAQDEDTYHMRIKQLPADFSNATVALGYHNGPLATTEMKRATIPELSYLDRKYDNSNYIKAQNCFFPGTMLSSDSNTSISAGVMVKKGSEERVTAAFHCWAKEYEDAPERLGNQHPFRVTQGDLKDGTQIGYMTERIGDTDIGLVKLLANIAFDNRFLEIDTTAKKLIHSDMVSYLDRFTIDSFVTGAQTLVCMGIRVRSKSQRERDIQGKPEDLPPPGQYISPVQGIYATSTREITGKPQIREGVCGAAIVRAKASGVAGNVLDKGEIAGFMHWSDLRAKSMSSTLLCYCETANGLIDNGWEVVQVAEKRKHGSTED